MTHRNDDLNSERLQLPRSEQTFTRRPELEAAPEVITKEHVWWFDLDRTLIDTDVFNWVFLETAQKVTEGKIHANYWYKHAKSLTGQRYNVVSDVKQHMTADEWQMLRDNLYDQGEKYRNRQPDQSPEAQKLHSKDRALFFEGAQELLESAGEDGSLIYTFSTAEEPQELKLIVAGWINHPHVVTTEEQSKVQQLMNQQADADGYIEVTAKKNGKNVLIRARKMSGLDDGDYNFDPGDNGTSTDESDDKPGVLDTYWYRPQGTEVDPDHFADGVVTHLGELATKVRRAPKER